MTYIYNYFLIDDFDYGQVWTDVLKFNFIYWRSSCKIGDNVQKQLFIMNGYNWIIYYSC